MIFANMKRTFLYILCIILTFCPSCDKQNNTVTLSSETEITRFYFAALDSFPSLANTTFTISNFGAKDTGLITNADSITYKTPITRLTPRLLFKATPSSTTVILSDSTSRDLTGKDTIDFSQPVLLRIISSDLSATKYYRVVVNVHQVDPDLFNWQRLNAAVLADGSAATKGVVLNDRFLLFANDGFSTTVFQSADGKTWDNGTTPSTLPASCRVREILAVNESTAKQALYYCQDGIVYTSSDGISWETQDLSADTYVPRIAMMYYNDTVWLVSEHNANHTFHLSAKDGDTWRANVTPLPDNWPLADFTVTTFLSSSWRPRAVIIGGYDIQGNPLHSLWNIEYSAATGYRFANFAIEHPQFSAVLGASAVSYGKRLYMFGGTDIDARYIANTAMYSEDEGLNWQPIDTVHNRLMDVYSPRTQTSAFVHDNCIYLMGGQSRTQIYSDVLRGKLTSIDWEN